MNRIRNIYYRFFRNNSVRDYSLMQKEFYRQSVKTLEHAYRIVHPDYDYAKRQSRTYLAYVLNDYCERRAPDIGGDTIDEVRNMTLYAPKIKILDFGCGVGRTMEELVHSGYEVDGVDISREMLDYARSNANLKDCSFYLGSGNDCGNAPAGRYDLVYSSLCLQHICVRTIRLEILYAIRNVLTPDGVVNIQFHYYPGVTADGIPKNHASWTEDKVDVWGTNSEADVWITPDQLHYVLEDFGRYFSDINFRFVQFSDNAYLFTEKYGAAFNHLIISASKALSFAERIYKPL